MTTFEDRIAVITGAGSGIGRALALALAERGTRVAVADVSVEAATATVALVGSRAIGYHCDVTNRAQIQDLLLAVQRDLGPPNFIFANAGVALGGGILDTEVRDFDWMFDVNVRGIFATVQIFVPKLIEQANSGNTAHFVFTGSENSFGVPLTGPSSVYTATKHAVLALADTLRRDLAGSKVGVSILCPGVVDTRIWDARRTRQERYGGQAVMPADYAERASKAMAKGQRPEFTATLCLEGIERGDFMIITDPNIRSFSLNRHGEVELALDVLAARLTHKEHLS